VRDRNSGTRGRVGQPTLAGARSPFVRGSSSIDLAIPELDEHGLLPAGSHVASLTEFRAAFVTHTRFSTSLDEREHLFSQLRKHRMALSTVVSIREHWIGGSMTADRFAAPHDCDVLYKLNRDDVEALGAGAKALVEYLLDERAAYSFFQLHPFVELLPKATSASGIIAGDLEVLFSQTKDGRPCGKVVVNDDE